jgi:hypothetical protein
MALAKLACTSTSRSFSLGVAILTLKNHTYRNLGQTNKELTCERNEIMKRVSVSIFSEVESKFTKAC